MSMTDYTFNTPPARESYQPPDFFAGQTTMGSAVSGQTAIYNYNAGEAPVGENSRSHQQDHLPILYSGPNLAWQSSENHKNLAPGEVVFGLTATHDNKTPAWLTLGQLNLQCAAEYKNLEKLADSSSGDPELKKMFEQLKENGEGALKSQPDSLESLLNKKNLQQLAYACPEALLRMFKGMGVFQNYTGTADHQRQYAGMRPTTDQVNIVVGGFTQDGVLDVWGAPQELSNLFIVVKFEKGKGIRFIPHYRASNAIAPKHATYKDIGGKIRTSIVKFVGTVTEGPQYRESDVHDMELRAGLVMGPNGYKDMYAARTRMADKRVRIVVGPPAMHLGVF